MPGQKNLDNHIMEPQPFISANTPHYERDSIIPAWYIPSNPRMEVERTLKRMGKTVLFVSVFLSIGWLIPYRIMCFAGLFSIMAYFILLNDYYTRLLNVPTSKAFVIRFLLWVGAGGLFLDLVISLYGGSSGDMIGGPALFYFFTIFITVPSEVAYLLNESVKKHRFLEASSSLAKTSILFPVFGGLCMAILYSSSFDSFFGDFSNYAGLVRFKILPSLFYFFFGLYHYKLTNKIVPEIIPHSEYHKIRGDSQ